MGIYRQRQSPAERLTTDELTALLEQAHLEIGRRMNADIKAGNIGTRYATALDSIRETRQWVERAEQERAENS